MRNNKVMKRLTVCVICSALVLGNAVTASALSYDEEDEELLSDDSEDEYDELSDNDEEELEDYYIEDYGNELSFESGIYGYDHRIETYLFIGTDDSGNETGTPGVDYRGGMADFLTLLVIDHTDDTYGFLEIDRNTMVTMAVTGVDGEFGGYDDLQICFSHFFGSDPENSCENSVEVVCEYLGELETIDGYYCLNMDDIGALADAVGGVEVTIEDDMTSIDPSFIPGAVVLLKGDQAEAYCRARMDVGEGDNESRMRRQKAYMESFYKKSIDLVKQDSNFVSDLYKLMKDLAVTNISGNDVSRITEAVHSGENKGILDIEGEAVLEKSHSDQEIHEAFYPRESSLIDAMTKLFSLKLIVSFADEEEAESDLSEVAENDS